MPSNFRYALEMVARSEGCCAADKAILVASQIVLGLLHALPIFPINYLQVLKCWFGVGGAARKVLQVSLLKQYLDYSDASRKRIGHTGFIQALLRDTVETVEATQHYQSIVAFVCSYPCTRTLFFMAGGQRLHKDL